MNSLELPALRHPLVDRQLERQLIYRRELAHLVLQQDPRLLPLFGVRRPPPWLGRLSFGPLLLHAVDVGQSQKDTTDERPCRSRCRRFPLQSLRGILQSSLAASSAW